ncbi:hypothetical protein SAMN02787142_8230 [Burkholderia sp. WP9]|nr:hypothetical protein [Burkholderia sp. WP9]SEF14178.1 hypothetical protein SAMN02787142_8230 [Burkholderia sp. WP9]
MKTDNFTDFLVTSSGVASVSASPTIGTALRIVLRERMAGLNHIMIGEAP